METKNLPEKLRELAHNIISWQFNSYTDPYICRKAADKIERQNAELERLQKESETDSSWLIVERFLQAVGIEPLSPTETTPEQIERAIKEIERMVLIRNKARKLCGIEDAFACLYSGKAAEAARED
jgi:hypothetical protein